MTDLLRKIRLGINFFTVMAYSKITDKTMPIIISLQVTKRCNLKCIHCYADLESLEGIKEFSSSELFNLIDNLFTLGTRRIYLLGGEPLLRDDIGEIIDYIKAKGIICELFSNGYLIKEKLNIVKKVDFFHISIDGDREINDKIRGQGSYDKILESLEVLASIRKHTYKVSLHCVPTRWNLHTLEHIANLAKKYQITFSVNEYAVPGGRELPELKLNGKDYEELYSQINNLIKKGYRITHSKSSLKYMLDYWPFPDKAAIYKQDIKKINRNSYMNCQLGKRHFFIDVDGNIYACPTRWKQGINFRDAGIYKAIEYAADRDCIICRELGFADMSNLLDLKPKTVLWAIKHYF